jgi:prevent-host-death family protein
VTIGGVLEAMGMRELRANLRAVVERVEAGNPVVCLKDGQPLAVMISHEEAEHWRKIEDALAVLHALGVYPEALADPSELADLASLQPPDLATIRRLTRSHGRSSRRYGRSASPMPGPPSPRSSGRLLRVGSERSSRKAIWRSRSSRRRNTTDFALSREWSAGSAAPGWTWPPRGPASSKSSTSSAPNRAGTGAIFFVAESFSLFEAGPGSDPMSPDSMKRVADQLHLT